MLGGERANWRRVIFLFCSRIEKSVAKKREKSKAFPLGFSIPFAEREQRVYSLRLNVLIYVYNIQGVPDYDTLIANS